jgi:type III pantothenate kinase
MNLIIDVGNTRIKIAVFSGSDLISQEQVAHDNFVVKAIENIEKFNCKNGIISAVGAIDRSELKRIKDKIHLIELNHKCKLPFNNNYASPKTLGVDRMALVAAAIREFPNKNTLIIDAGTCITYDFVNFEGDYKGGAISPGLSMRYQSLNQFTDKLPLLKALDEAPDLIGNSTEASMHSGVQNGMIIEIEGLIEQYRKKNKDLTIVLTGGDLYFLSNRLKNGIFANPNFLIIGLNTILTYNL